VVALITAYVKEVDEQWCSVMAHYVSGRKRIGLQNRVQLLICLYVKVKQSHHRPGGTQRVPGS